MNIQTQDIDWDGKTKEQWIKDYNAKCESMIVTPKYTREEITEAVFDFELDTPSRVAGRKDHLAQIEDDLIDYYDNDLMIMSSPRNSGLSFGVILLDEKDKVLQHIEGFVSYDEVMDAMIEASLLVQALPTETAPFVTFKTLLSNKINHLVMEL